MVNYQFSGSLSPGDGAQAMFNLKTAFKNAGFTVVSSSDGTTFGSGDLITSASDFNNNAWYVVRAPVGPASVQREMSFQRGTSNRTWRGAYSYSSSFTGSADATTIPNALDQVRIWGGEFPNFGFATNVWPVDGTYRQHICVDVDSPHSWYMVFVPTGGGDPDIVWMCDGMVNDTSASNDTDPIVFYFASTSPLNGTAAATGPSSTVTASTIQTPACWTRKGESDEQYGGIAALAYVDGDTGELSDGSGTGTTNAYNNKDDLFPVIWFRGGSANPTGPGGYKGVSRLMKVPSGPARSTGDTYSTTASGSRDFIRFNDYCLVWDGSEPTI